MCSITGVGKRLRKVLGQIDLGTLDSGERSLPFGLLVFCCCFFLLLLFFKHPYRAEQAPPLPLGIKANDHFSVYIIMSVSRYLC